jgi:hypothetical protein
MRRLAKSPDGRFSSAAELADSLALAAAAPPALASDVPPGALAAVELLLRRSPRRGKPRSVAWVVLTSKFTPPGGALTIRPDESGKDLRKSLDPFILPEEWVERTDGQLDAWKSPDRPPQDTALVDVYRPRWITWGRPLRTVDGRDYQCDCTCDLTFELESKPELPWVAVEEVKAVVTEYQPMPKHLLLEWNPEGMRVVRHLYVARIGHPAVAKANAFVATYHEREGGEPKKDVFVRLERGKPEAFNLRIRPREPMTPGIYTFVCEVTVSSRNAVSRQRVGGPQSLFFR